MWCDYEKGSDVLRRGPNYLCKIRNVMLSFVRAIGVRVGKSMPAGEMKPLEPDPVNTGVGNRSISTIPSRFPSYRCVLNHRQYKTSFPRGVYHG